MTRRGRSIVAVLALLAVAGAGYLMLSDGPAARVAELIGQRGEKQLKDPMRSARGGTRVLFFALDGVGEDELLQAIRSGRVLRVAWRHVATVRRLRRSQTRTRTGPRRRRSTATRSTSGTGSRRTTQPDEAAK
jgi:hypothetical protein